MVGFPRLSLLRMKASHARMKLAQTLPSQFQVGSIYATPEGKFAVPSSDLFFPHLWRQGKAFGQEEIALIRALVPEGSTILVVGGHVGGLAIPLARTAQKLTVVEANPETFRYLAANVALNASHNISLLQLAAGEKEGQIEFIANRQNTGGSKRSPVIDDWRYTYDDPDRIRVEMKRLDDVLEPQYDAMVMDIEGSEYFALKGMPKLLSRIRTIFIEFMPHHLRNVAGIDADRLYDVIGSDFRHLLIPSQNTTYSGDEVAPKLRSMFQEDQNEDAIVFSKDPIQRS